MYGETSDILVVVAEDFFLKEGVWRSRWMWLFGTYHGASTIMRRAFDWKRSSISMLDVDAVPQWTTND
jgi:hypothetical protein